VNISRNLGSDFRTYHVRANISGIAHLTGPISANPSPAVQDRGISELAYAAEMIPSISETANTNARLAQRRFDDASRRLADKSGIAFGRRTSRARC
jgi:hypothetical protein